MPTGLGHPDERGGHLAHLGDAAGRAVDVGRGDGLDRVDDQQSGPDRVDVAEHRAQVGLGGEEQVRVEGTRCGRPACAPVRRTPRRSRRASGSWGRRSTPPPRGGASTCPRRVPPRAGPPLRGRCPPPSTRSSSSTPVGRAWVSSASTSWMRRAGSVTGPASVVRPGAPPGSATVPHAWHSPHRPTHLGVCHPHSEHRSVTPRLPPAVRPAAFAMPATLGPPADTPAEGDATYATRRVSRPERHRQRGSAGWGATVGVRATWASQCRTSSSYAAGPMSAVSSGPFET